MPVIPSRAGIGLRHPHIKHIAHARPEISWLEVHSENYFAAGSAAYRYLCDIAPHYPLSAHSIGLSLGRADDIDLEHLKQLKQFIETFNPALISDHLSFSGIGGVYTPDLLPIAYTHAMLEIVASHIHQVQHYLGRQLLIENPSGYACYAENQMNEPDFLAALVKKTGCGLLLDVNNLMVAQQNLIIDPYDYVAHLPLEAIGEIHLAGYSMVQSGAHTVYIDDHSQPVYPHTWQLYQHILTLTGARPTLIEWDTDIPALEVLLDEAAKADALLKAHAYA